jgi:lysine 6-dehydrogenase
MKVFALGGSGSVGQSACHILAADDLASEIIVAGRNVEAAERVARRLGGKGTAVQADATVESQLASLAAKCDIIVNTAGPDFKVQLPAVRAAIAARTHYCDIGGDGLITERVLGLDGDARAAGIAVVPGIGIAPGVTNLMAMHAAGQLDETEEVEFGYCWRPEFLRQDTAEMRRSGRIDAGWQTVFRYTSGRVRCYRDGRMTDVNALESGTEVTLPQTGTVVTAYPVDSSEPLTLPRYLAGVRKVSALMGFFPPQLNDVFRRHALRLSAGEVDEAEAALSFLEAVADEMRGWVAAQEGFPWVPVWATALGRKGGRRARYSCWPTAVWGLMTGWAVAVAALKIMRGEIRQSGVLPPEACLEPMPFFAEMAQRGFQQPPDGKLLGESFEVVD